MKPHFQVHPGHPTPIWRQIVDQVRSAIASGELRAGEALPSVRAVAALLVVNPNTELTRHGDAVSEAGRGLFVAAAPPTLPGAERKKKLQVAVERLVTECVHLGVSRATAITAIHHYCDKNDVLPNAEEGEHD
jgi:GntR family transcriptional regulator